MNVLHQAEIDFKFSIHHFHEIFPRVNRITHIHQLHITRTLEAQTSELLEKPNRFSLEKEDLKI